MMEYNSNESDDFGKNRLPGDFYQNIVELENNLMHRYTPETVEDLARLYKVLINSL